MMLYEEEGLAWLYVYIWSGLVEKKTQAPLSVCVLNGPFVHEHLARPSMAIPGRQFFEKLVLEAEFSFLRQRRC